MHYQSAALAAIAVFGHWAFCVYLINRIHATGLPHRLVKLIDLFWYVCVLVPPVLILGRGAGAIDVEVGSATWAIVRLYGWFCVAIAAVAVIQWMVGRQIGENAQLQSDDTQRVNAVERLGQAPSGSFTTSVASRLPGNQVFELRAQDKTLILPQLHPALEGLTITHLSDLHFTGTVTEEFFHLVVDIANERPSDLVVISGDIIDKRICFPWLSSVLGRLQSREVSCFVLGNHDVRIHDEEKLRSELVSLGMIDLGRAYHVAEIGDRNVLLVGNELPWFKPLPDFSNAPSSDLRIAVSHSPDQYPWARENAMDLMLAGHTHGGQIRLPLVGPIFSPSRFGVRYSAGSFFEPPTVLHVSRGLSGTRPLRFNCPPEIARLKLVRS